MLFYKIRLIYLLLLGLVLSVSLFWDIRLLWGIGLLSVVYLATIIYGSFTLEAGLYVKAICQTRQQNNTFTLTFDDGPDPVYTLPILSILEKHKAHAVFFCIGHKIETHPNLVAQIIEKGHIIGNHSYSHTASHGFLGNTAIETEIEKTEHLITKIAGHSYKLYRPPFGVTNPQIANAINKYGLKLVGWNIRSFDTVAKNPEAIMERIKEVKAGDIILLHDTIAFTASLLDDFLALTTSKGLRASLSTELMNK